MGNRPAEEFTVYSDEVLTESELARRARVSISVLRKWRREGQGPRFLKLGRLVRYRAQDIQAWLDAHALDGNQPPRKNPRPVAAGASR